MFGIQSWIALPQQHEEMAPSFDHFAPSAWLIRNPAFLDGNDAAMQTVLERAGKLFVALNALLRV